MINLNTSVNVIEMLKSTAAVLLFEKQDDVLYSAVGVRDPSTLSTQFRKSNKVLVPPDVCDVICNQNYSVSPQSPVELRRRLGAAHKAESNGTSS